MALQDFSLIDLLGFDPEEQERKKREHEELVKKIMDDQLALRTQNQELLSRDTNYYRGKAKKDVLKGIYGVDDYEGLSKPKKVGLGILDFFATIGRKKDMNAIADEIAGEEQKYDTNKALAIEKILSGDQRSLLANQMKERLTEGDQKLKAFKMYAENDLNQKKLALQKIDTEAKVRNLDAKTVLEMKKAVISDKDIEVYNKAGLLPKDMPPEMRKAYVYSLGETGTPEQQRLTGAMEQREQQEQFNKYQLPLITRGLLGGSGAFGRGGPQRIGTITRRETPQNFGGGIEGTRILTNTSQPIYAGGVGGPGGVGGSTLPPKEALSILDTLYGNSYSKLKKFDMSSLLGPDKEIETGLIPKRPKDLSMQVPPVQPGQTYTIPPSSSNISDLTARGLADENGKPAPGVVTYAKDLDAVEAGKPSPTEVFKLPPGAEKLAQDLSPEFPGLSKDLSPGQKGLVKRYIPEGAHVALPKTEAERRLAKLQSDIHGSLLHGFVSMAALSKMSDKSGGRNKLSQIVGPYNGSLGAWGREVAPGIVGEAQTPEEGQLRVALMQASNAAGRYDSGAQMNMMEVQLYKKLYGRMTMGYVPFVQQLTWTTLRAQRHQWFTKALGEELGRRVEDEIVSDAALESLNGTSQDPMMELIKKLSAQIIHGDPIDYNNIDIEKMYKKYLVKRNILPPSAQREGGVKSINPSVEANPKANSALDPFGIYGSIVKKGRK